MGGEERGRGIGPKRVGYLPPEMRLRQALFAVYVCLQCRSISNNLSTTVCTL